MPKMGKKITKSSNVLKFSFIETLTMVFQKVIQNDQKYVVFVMNSLITRIICWKTTVENVENFFRWPWLE